jgi:hypothetical protein
MYAGIPAMGGGVRPHAPTTIRGFDNPNMGFTA